MKPSEILRGIADMLDQQEAPTQTVDAPLTVQNQTSQLKPDSVEVDTTDQTEKDTMIAPLQQSLELMKKVAGVDSFYDNECEMDDLDRLKTTAGIVPITISSGT